MISNDIQAALASAPEINLDAHPTPGSRCARVSGVNLHANVSIPARDRVRLLSRTANSKMSRNMWRRAIRTAL